MHPKCFVPARRNHPLLLWPDPDPGDSQGHRLPRPGQCGGCPSAELTHWCGDLLSNCWGSRLLFWGGGLAWGPHSDSLLIRSLVASASSPSGRPLPPMPPTTQLLWDLEAAPHFSGLQLLLHVNMAHPAEAAWSMTAIRCDSCVCAGENHPKSQRLPIL